MIIVGNVSHQHGLTYEDPAKMANAILPFTNSFVRNAILLMFCNAAVLGTTAISLSSAWAWSATRGWKHSLNMSFKDAPGFYCIYAICTLLAASIVLIPGAPLQLIILGVQVLAGIILPSAIIFLQLLLNDHKLLGDRWVNQRWNNAVNWTIIVLLFALSLVLAAQVMAPSLFPTGS
jgi:Mn2+/Fe2+ NRAMP family transporter